MGTRTSKQIDEAELRVQELESYSTDQAKRIIKLYAEVDTLKQQKHCDTEKIDKLLSDIDLIHKQHNTDIFVYLDAMDEITKITESVHPVNKPSSSLSQNM